MIWKGGDEIDRNCWDTCIYIRKVYEYTCTVRCQCVSQSYLHTKTGTSAHANTHIHDNMHICRWIWVHTQSHMWKQIDMYQHTVANTHTHVRTFTSARVEPCPSAGRRLQYRGVSVCMYTICSLVCMHVRMYQSTCTFNVPPHVFVPTHRYVWVCWKTHAYTRMFLYCYRVDTCICNHTCGCPNLFCSFFIFSHATVCKYLLLNYVENRAASPHPLACFFLNNYSSSLQLFLPIARDELEFRGG